MVALTAILIFNLMFATVQAEKDAVRSQIINNIAAGLEPQTRSDCLANK